MISYHWAPLHHAYIPKVAGILASVAASKLSHTEPRWTIPEANSALITTYSVQFRSLTWHNVLGNSSRWKPQIKANPILQKHQKEIKNTKLKNDSFFPPDLHQIKLNPSQPDEKGEKTDAAQKKWQNITSLFNKAALSVLLISNILPQVLVKRNRKNPLQALCLQRVLQFSCAQQNSQYVISLEFAH